MPALLNWATTLGRDDLFPPLREFPPLTQPIPERFHALAHGSVRQGAAGRGLIVFEVRELCRARDRAGDRRMRHDVLQEELGPTRCELARPRGHGLTANPR